MPTNDARLGDLSLTSLECREANHKWRRVREDNGLVATGFKGKKTVEVMDQRVCDACGTRRDDFYSLPGYETVRRRYWHPAGYLLKRGENGGRLLVNDFRAELFHRINPPIVEAAQAA